ncbi:flagellar basal body rod modification protein FlgD [Liquorilactobacillus sucicola DSM 21376 = JCM 15457]|uniref:Flagellar basal body rod modification protein n=2 Tax=Liquorilactobacillus sucicola TaxID=519050 RepID=A0A023CWP6_9LACO|nr:flagellar hook capping FlgD N-terminal domain-containing protein [Liquorilactobacillus sucicola]AJA34377.1 flagellar basal-body rod modification protein FlgD [Liquorilactobacillus sucicola]KRN06841.1 hypothetical protein FD15_GL000400 [Liquorilactobacillus sucicola DSM 21376 = JCM 15457]GAJ26318.1 flagellar basal body rod modification protein FlgD [Liquorilactobacillus sucicola DSM 21376 = JCM 15457]
MNNTISDAVPSVADATAYNTTKNSSGVSMESFLKIMAASMSNPSMSGGDSGSSGSGTDYVSQLAQFTTLDQLNAMGKNLTSSVMIMQQQEAFNLLGKNVTLNDGGNSVTGKVDKVRFNNGYATLVVNNKEYSMSTLNEVG